MKLSREEHKNKLLEMRVGRVDKDYLTNMVLEYKIHKNIDNTYPMPSELADIVIIIVDKMLGSNSWRKYSDDWKEEFRGRAMEHVLKYAHNFDATKSANGKNDPYNYFAMIISNAFIQSWSKLKKYTDNNLLINQSVIHAFNTWDDDQTGNRNDIESVTPDIERLDWGESLY